MKILKELTLILLVSVAGEALSLIMPIPMPGSILALFIMAGLLFSGLLKIDHIRNTADYLLGNIAIFFIPSCVGIIDYLDLLKTNWWQILLATSLSVLITFAVTGYAVALTMKLMRRKKA